MLFRRMPIEIESPEQLGYATIKNNLSESSYTDTLFRNIGDPAPDLHNLVLCYGSHAGHEGLRDLIANENPGISRDDILLTAGAAAALFIIAASLLQPEDEIIVVRPNYATNLETPRTLGASLHYIDLRFEDHFSLDLDAVKNAITPRTKYISVTYPHNPSGVCLNHDAMNSLVDIAASHNVRLLVDETYRDMTFAKPLPLAATWSDRVISVSSLSKTFGLPGLRLGWIVCRDKTLMETFLAAKEQIFICGSVLDETVAFHYLTQKEKYFPAILHDIREKFLLVKNWVSRQNDFEWVEPGGGAVCLFRIKSPKKVNLDLFYDILLKKYGTYVGPGHWFDMPRHYMRIGYGWPDKTQLENGLNALQQSLREARR